MGQSNYSRKESKNKKKNYENKSTLITEINILSLIVDERFKSKKISFQYFTFARWKCMKMSWKGIFSIKIFVGNNF